MRGAAVIASASLVVAEPATTADASGGASAFRAATERLALAIAQWIAETDRALSGGLGIAGRCQR